MTIEQLKELIRAALSKEQSDAAIKLIDALDLERRQANALFHQLDAVIGAALIDKDNWEHWLGLHMEKSDTPYDLYDDAEEFYRNYTMSFPITVDEHKAEVERLNAVFKADLERDESDDE